MQNLMVLHWGTVTQTINLNCGVNKGSFTNKPARGFVCQEQYFDAIPRYEGVSTQEIEVFN